ncbi:MAG: flavodoxin family protein [Methanosphaera sp.]|uniref:flavodoxin family protein n=1 Tax=Methanosphaera sp. TaxID=2666342 RepID=UPI002E75FFB9|nr:flavodoxin family protein [Methanosphaera sp.]MEE1117396.1 flavodoxin family protein [Methanosphaera sp.]MEE3325248.1 flavodoxin family protein [Methanosphaera sp.]MEE3418468.1 flavodoxin family protein [Methanosphaera sp.]
MKFYLINGSNRRKFNTAKLIDAVAEGITDELDNQNKTAKVEIIDLYTLEYKGCKSCLHCKKIEGKYYGTCPIKDDLNELLPKFWGADALILGSPIYFRNVTGQMRCFLERLLFPKYVYGGESLSKPKHTAMIYDMNVSEEISNEKYDHIYDNIEDFLEYTFKIKPYSLKVYDTYQFKDYSLYQHNFDEEAKRKQMEEQFPKDLEEAYNIGVQLVKDVIDAKN